LDLRNASKDTSMTADELTVMGFPPEVVDTVVAHTFFNPEDARFLSKPIGYVVFNGLESGANEITICFTDSPSPEDGLSSDF